MLSAAPSCCVGSDVQHSAGVWHSIDVCLGLLEGIALHHTWQRLGRVPQQPIAPSTLCFNSARNEAQTPRRRLLHPCQSMPQALGPLWSRRSTPHLARPPRPALPSVHRLVRIKVRWGQCCCCWLQTAACAAFAGSAAGCCAPSCPLRVWNTACCCCWPWAPRDAAAPAAAADSGVGC